MEEFSQRIRRATDDLKAIQHELMRASVGHLPEDAERQIESVMTTHLIHDFKGAVDHMRSFLWSYIEAAKRADGDGVTELASTLRIKRATEILEMLKPNVLGSAEPSPETRSFLEVVQSIADQAVTRHIPPKNRS